MPSSRLSAEESKLEAPDRACSALACGVYSSAEGGSGVSMMPASGLLETAGTFAAGGGGAGAGAGAATAAGGVTGACSLVVMLSFAGGTETPSYGLGLALVGADCATSMVLLKTNVAAATREKRVFV